LRIFPRSSEQTFDGKRVVGAQPVRRAARTERDDGDDATTRENPQDLWTGAGIRVTTGESGFESFRGLGAIAAYRLMMSATCWQNVSADNCGRCLVAVRCRPPAAFHVLFRASGVPGDDDHCCCRSGGGDRRLIRGVGVCDRQTGGWCPGGCAAERFRRNGDCTGLGVSLPPAERLRGGRVTRAAGGVPATTTKRVKSIARAKRRKRRRIKLSYGDGDFCRVARV